MIRLDISKTLHGSGGAMELKIDTQIETGEFIALAGPSGSGKTTLLRIIAGLENAAGTLHVDEERWMDGTTSLPPQKRKIGFVFQDYALFPNMSVLENLLFVQKDHALAVHLLDITGLSELKNRLPATLSGGQKQRVSLCRAFMNRPKVLLMDEPLSALDPQMRSKLQQEILALHREFKTTTIMVSHDPGEIYRLADRVLFLEHGRIVKNGTPRQMLLNAAENQKFSFAGELLDIIRADIVTVAVVAIGQQIVQVAITQQEASTLNIGQKVLLSSHPFSVTLRG